MGSAAMKPREEGGVVDSRLNVYGVQGLKVADLSICPDNVGAVSTVASSLNEFCLIYSLCIEPLLDVHSYWRESRSVDCGGFGDQDSQMKSPSAKACKIWPTDLKLHRIPIPSQSFCHVIFILFVLLYRLAPCRKMGPQFVTSIAVFFIIH